MKKIIFTLLLAIVSSVWTTSNAFCMVAKTPVDGQTVSISGVLIQTAMPCGDEEPCANCLTLALSANEDLYYLSTTDPVVERQLDSIMSELVSVYCICEQPAVVTGVQYTRGSFHYIAISTITALGDIQPKSEDLRLPSICDEWNIAKISNAMGPYEEIHTVKAALSTDTIIGTQKYVKLFEAGRYKGALREGTNRDIYYIPSSSAHEYLLYNFNANVGDTLSNLWYGGSAERCPNGYNATVLSISEGTPKVFTVEVEYILSDSDGDHIVPWVVFWTEGVGMSDGPAGQICPGPDCECSCGQVVLCAYKNGEHIYTSDLGKKYGCEYSYDPYLTPDPTPLRLPSICDEWNVLSHSMSLGPEYESFKTLHFSLTSDTIINETRYVKLEQDGTYKGALREGTNANIYYVPNNSTHEYLLYAFNAQVGDSLDNLWFGANENENYFVSSATVVNIEPTTPRKFTIDFEWQSIYSYAAINDTSEIMHAELVWLEGLGFQYGGPLNYECPFDCAGAPGMLILCAYKNGEQVYTSDWGKKYGCEFNYDPFAPSDTIPLYLVKDGPGTSTVDPVDPNLIYALLQREHLFIRDFSGAEIYCTLVNKSIPANSPRRVRLQTEPFKDSLAVEITDAGLYEINLTSEAWDYTVIGSFTYDIEEGISFTTPEQPSAQKIIRDGQILIRRGEKIYTLQGQQLQ